MAFALTMLVSIVMLPVLASANSGNQMPDCNADPEACQVMLAQYEELYGPLPPPTSSEEVETVAEIEIVPGDNGDPPADVQAQMSENLQELQGIARTVCTDPENYGWQKYIHDELTAGEDPVALIASISRMSGYADLETSANWQLADARSEGYTAPSRVPTFEEAIAPYIGCATGEYQGK